jgi:hypothetical protein
MASLSGAGPARIQKKNSPDPARFKARLLELLAICAKARPGMTQIPGMRAPPPIRRLGPPVATERRG